MKYLPDDVHPAEQARVLVSAYACVRDPGSQLPGGGDLMAWNIVVRLSRHCQMWVLTSALNRPAIDNEMENQSCRNLHFHFVGLPGCLRFLNRFAGGVQLYAYLWQWRAFFAARRLHAQIGFNAFHHLTYENDWMASPAGALLPVPYLRGPGGGAHRTPRQFGRRYPFAARLWERFRIVGQWIFRHDPFFILGQSRAQSILVCNREALDAMPEKWRHKARLCPVNGVSRETLRDGRTEYVRSRFRIVTAGRLIPLKGFDLAIRAFAQFLERTKIQASATEVSLSIIGEGPERKRLENLSRSIGLDDFVRYLAWKPREELWAQMRSSDVFLFTSLRDGGGLVVVEAMAAALPVICIDLGGPAMHITSECGFKVKAETPDQVISELSSALKTLYFHPELRSKMGSAARRRAEQFYLWDVLAERLLDEYQAVFARSAEWRSISREEVEPRATDMPRFTTD